MNHLVQFLKLKSIIIFAFYLLFASCSPKEDSSLQTILGQTMGTSYSIKFKIEPGFSTKDQIKAGVELLLKKINNEMSTYIPTSEISRFNLSNETDTWINVSKNFAFTVHQAIEISNKTDKAFDITMGPLVNRWGFGPVKGQRNQTPDEREIKKILSNTGIDKIQVKLNPPALKKQNPKIFLDLSGIAKGLGVDLVAQYLEGLQIQNYLVEIGGEMRAKGLKSKNKPWTIGIEGPIVNKRTIQKVMALSNLSMATSGSYRNFYETNQGQFSHTIDPRTGRPITHNLVSITVLHKNCFYADAIATAFSVLGLERSFELATQWKLPVYFLIKTENGVEEKYTEEFKTYLI